MIFNAASALFWLKENRECEVIKAHAAAKAPGFGLCTMFNVY